MINRMIFSFMIILMCGCGPVKDQEPQPLGKPLNKAEKVKLIGELKILAESGVSESVLVEWVKRLRRSVPLEVDDILQLKKLGVGERVVRLMIRGAPPEMLVE